MKEKTQMKDSSGGAMRVLIISHEYPYRGNEIRATFVNEQVEELARQGCQVRVISPVPWAPFPISALSPKWKEYSNILQQDIFNGIQVYYPRVLTFPRNILKKWSGRLVYAGIRKTVRQLVNGGYDFDIIHAHHAFPDGYAGLLLSKEYKKPLVVTAHGMDIYSTIYHNKHCYDAVKQVFEEASQVITVSSKLKKQAKMAGIPINNVIVLGNGIPDRILDNLYTCNNKDLVMLSVASLIQRKGIEYNIKAMAALQNRYPDLTYRIIGNGPEYQNLKSIVKKMGLSDKISFVSALNHETVFNEMAQCAFLSLPSWDEAFGLVYIEAMIQGKPVIACKGEGIEDVIQHGVNGMLVSPKDVDSLSAAIDFLLSHPNEANQIGQRARDTVIKDYTWGKIVQKLIKIYEQNIK